MKAGTGITQHDPWVSYGGTARIGLAIALLIVAVGLVYAGTRLPLPVRAAKPRKRTVIFVLLSWVVAIDAFLFGAITYTRQEQHDYHAAEAVPAMPIAPVTLLAAVAIFVTILITSSSYGSGTRLAGAVIAAVAAPMIFELPFNLITMARIYPPITPDPALYRTLFFLPLLLIDIITLSFLALSPMVRLSKATFLFLALMFIVFAFWSLFGFAYPSAPAPLALNTMAKILAFITALSMFLPGRRGQRAASGLPGSAQAARGRPHASARGGGINAAELLAGGSRITHPAWIFRPRGNEPRSWQSAPAERDSAMGSRASLRRKR